MSIQDSQNMVFTINYDLPFSKDQKRSFFQTDIITDYPKEPIMDEYISIFPNANAHQLTEMDLNT